MYVFIMEPYIHWNPPTEYHSINLGGLYKNTLWIRNDIRKGKCISRTQYGIKIDNVAFRYIPPNVRKEELNLEEIEVGDWNFLSNKWINVNKPIYAEVRDEKPGGNALITNVKSEVKFLRGDGDHAILLANVFKKIKPKLKTDHHKLLVALEDGIQGRANSDVYTYDRKWKTNRRLIIHDQNEKLINPIAARLPLDDWYELYHHDPFKKQPIWYYPKISNNTSKNITSKAEDINNFQIKKLILLTRKLDTIRKQKLLQAFGWIKFASRTVCLRKKDKEPDKVKNLRPIQISPWNFKIAEQSRNELKVWLDNQTDARCYAFKRKSKIDDMIKWIKDKIK